MIRLVNLGDGGGEEKGDRGHKGCSSCPVQKRTEADDHDMHAVFLQRRSDLCTPELHVNMSIM